MSVTEVNEIFSRLFDHRPFLQTEIANFKREFEQKRGDKEVEELFKALEHTTEIKQVRFEKVVEACDANLPRTIADIQVALRMCEDTLKVEDKFKAINYDVLEKKRIERENRLASSRLDYEEKLKNLEENYHEKEREIREQFAKLEKNLLK
ncbi:UNVERIFIED_CONTAM: hypothetical protein RMT77_002306 [Armadillidium vulgare]